MKKFSYFLFFSLLALSGFAQKNQPNIVYILADDLGYGDVSAYNPTGQIKTPYIDQLAKQGMQFLDAHSASGVCTPTRYGILTGRYPFRSALPVGVLRGYSRALIEKDQQTVASLLASAGYETGVVGKWHLGLDWTLLPGNEGKLQQTDIRNELDPAIIDYSKKTSAGPNTVGFGYSYILPASLDMPPYLYLENQQVEESPTGYTKGNKEDKGYAGPFWREGKMAPSFDFHEVLPRFTQKAEAFIGKQTAKKPFFLYLPLAAPHTPWMPKPEYKASSGAGEYGDFVQQVDASVGAILKKLDQMGFSKNTLVIFTSDNGPYWRPDYIERFHHQSAGEFRGMKGDAFEGGHRIPFLARWPGTIQAASQSSATISLTSLMATVAEITGKKSTAEDSYSILPVLQGMAKQVAGQPAVIVSSSTGYFTIRKGDWKLIEGLGSGGFTEPKEIKQSQEGVNGQLFNLALDPKETQDVFATNPQKVAELRALLQEIKKYPKK